MKEGTIKLAIWGEGWCDEPFDIINSNGFSLASLVNINEQLLEDDFDWSKYYERDLIIKVNHISAQIGNYPPPNIETEEYWEWEIIKQFKWDDNPMYSVDEEDKEWLSIL